MSINELIKIRRRELGLTLEEIASAVGVTKSTVRKWETGDIKNMRRDKMALLADILKIPPTSLLYEDYEKRAKASSAPPLPVCSMNCTAHEKELIRKYRCLPPPVQNAVDTMIEGQYELVRPRVKNEEEIS